MALEMIEYYVCPFCSLIGKTSVCSKCSTVENFEVSVIKAKSKSKLFFAFHKRFEASGQSPEAAINNMIAQPNFIHSY